MTAVACAHVSCLSMLSLFPWSFFKWSISVDFSCFCCPCFCERHTSGELCFTCCAAQGLHHAGVLPDANVVSSIPMMLEAFCLHEKGRALITEHAPLRALVPLLSHRAYCTPDSAGMAPLQLPDFSSGLEELVRHMPHALCYHAVDAVLASLRVRLPLDFAAMFQQSQFVLVVCQHDHLGYRVLHAIGSITFLLIQWVPSHA